MALFCTGNDPHTEDVFGCPDWESSLRPEDLGVIPWNRSRVVCVGCLEDILEVERQTEADMFERYGYPEDAMDTEVTPWYAHN